MKNVAALLLTLVSVAAQAEDTDPAKWKQSTNGTWVQISDAECHAGPATAEAIDACRIWSDNLRSREEARERERRQAMPSPRIGMTPKQVVEKTSYGPPRDINRTITRARVNEQWVYGRGVYLYFENGKLTAMQD